MRTKDRKFALMERDEIGEPGRPPLLTRWRVVQTPLAALYVHRHHRPDGDRELHDHPWPFLSWIVRGGYEETSYVATEIGPVVATHYRPRWSWAYRRANDFHRISRVDPGTWTVMLLGRRRRNWGFQVPGEGWVAWETFTARPRT
jgi:hypothetical protein